jgi:hypothetical protein
MEEDEMETRQVTELNTHAGAGLSRPTPPPGEPGPGPAPAQDVPLADFYEPLTFAWTEDDFEIAKAVEAYCNSAYADH